MICAVYKSPKKDQTYLFVERRDDFSRVPDSLLAIFGRPSFLMLLPLRSDRSLALADAAKVRLSLEQQGYYLQLPPPQENLLAQHRAALTAAGQVTE